MEPEILFDIWTKGVSDTGHSMMTSKNTDQNSLIIGWLLISTTKIFIVSPDKHFNFQWVCMGYTWMFFCHFTNGNIILWFPICFPVWSSPTKIGFTIKRICSWGSKFFSLTLLHSKWPKLCRVLAILSAIWLRTDFSLEEEKWEC